MFPACEDSENAYLGGKQMTMVECGGDTIFLTKSMPHELAMHYRLARDLTGG